MDSNLDGEKVDEIYSESLKIVRNGQRQGLTKSEIANQIFRKIKEIVDEDSQDRTY